MFEEFTLQPDLPKENLVRVSKALEHNVRNALLYAKNPDERILETLNVFRSNIAQAFPEKQEISNQIFNDIENMNIQNGEELIALLPEKLAELLANNYSLLEIEKRLQPQFENEETMERINRLVDVERLRNGDTNVLRLHIPVTFVENPIELRGLFIEALTILTQKIRDEDRYRDIQGLTAYSTLIYKNPEILKKLGFTITDIDDEKGIAEASIEKGDLIRLYGNT